MPECELVRYVLLDGQALAGSLQKATPTQCRSAKGPFSGHFSSTKATDRGDPRDTREYLTFDSARHRNPYPISFPRLLWRQVMSTMVYNKETT